MIFNNTASILPGISLTMGSQLATELLSLLETAWSMRQSSSPV
jgi:hypothetical protein